MVHLRGSGPFDALVVTAADTNFAHAPVCSAAAASSCPHCTLTRLLLLSLAITVGGAAATLLDFFSYVRFTHWWQMNQRQQQLKLNSVVASRRFTRLLCSRHFRPNSTISYPIPNNRLVGKIVLGLHSLFCSFTVARQYPSVGRLHYGYHVVVSTIAFDRAT